ncbi:hypothetical protein CesoFtcFv8_025051 [Champsocephalus esox]|uniref:Uncharacterized protein n=1 Tax=Champsocephalus esox TaxID=159716 RepID=A0AAN8B334_9TELE|nr:hypothetical protein CesoFtcFv8_025051 [Champsocephalus esox]
MRSFSVRDTPSFSFTLERARSGKIMAEDSEHLNEINVSTRQTFRVVLSVGPPLHVQPAPNVHEHHYSALYLIISSSWWECGAVGLRTRAVRPPTLRSSLTQPLQTLR